MASFQKLIPGPRRAKRRPRESESDITLVPQLDFNRDEYGLIKSVSILSIPSTSTEYHPTHDYRPLRESQGDFMNIQKWPSAPMTLGNNNLDILLHVLHDLFMLLVPIPFFVLAGTVLRRNGKSVDEDDWNRLRAATKIAVTVFPIAFAAVAGRASVSLASWRLERGVQLGIIEQLVGSQTFFGTLTTQFFLRSFNSLGLGLILFWALSPIGGQSSLHIISTANEPLGSGGVLMYLNSRATSQFAIGGDFRQVLPPLNALYLSSLMAPESVKSSSMDLWGNVKIPRLSSLESKPSLDGWIDVPQLNGSYTSLMGIPVAGIPLGGKSSFTLESSYFDLDCENATLGNEINITTGVILPGQKPNTTYFGGDGRETCKIATDCTVSFSIAMDHFASVNWTFGFPEGIMNNSIPTNGGNEGNHAKTVVDEAPPTILFQSRYWGDTEFTYSSTRAFCKLKQVYVESAVHCDAGQSQADCSVTSMRASRQPDLPPDTVTSLSFSSVLSNFADSLAASGGGGHEATSSPTELYLFNPGAPLMVDPDAELKLWELPLPTLSLRLTQVLNTYWLGSINPQSMVGDLARAPFQTFAGPPTNLTTGFAATRLVETYIVDFGWLSVYVLATCALSLAAVMGVVMDHMTIAPVILGFVSSLTRDSPYVKLPRGGSTLDGYERARLLKRMRVRLGDVRTERGGSGYMAFSNDGMAGQPSKGRFYD